MDRGERTEKRFLKSGRRTDSAGRGLLQALFAVVIVILGALIAFVFIKMKEPPQRVEHERLAPLVAVKQLNIQDIPMVIRGHGTVRPKVEVEIVPEVPGKVVFVHPELKAGGFVSAGQQILRIDRRDYELAVQQAKAAVAETQVRLDTEIAEADVAHTEWQQLHPNTEPASPLVFREPQIRQAKAALESAKSRLATAQLSLERTGLSLPFDVLIISEKVDLGQYVVVGQSLGVAYGIESFEVEVPIEDEELAWFDVLKNSFSGKDTSADKQILAEVKAVFAGGEHVWKGYVTRTTGQVDKMSRMVPVVIEVPDPFEASDGRPPLLPNTFVDVSIQGEILKQAVAVPRDAIHEGNKVWLVNDGRLHVKPTQVARADEDFAYVTSGIDDKAVIIVSSLDTVVEGMKVRTHFGENTDAEQLGQSKGSDKSEAN